MTARIKLCGATKDIECISNIFNKDPPECSSSALPPLVCPKSEDIMGSPSFGVLQLFKCLFCCASVVNKSIAKVNSIYLTWTNQIKWFAMVNLIFRRWTVNLPEAAESKEEQLLSLLLPTMCPWPTFTFLTFSFFRKQSYFSWWHDQVWPLSTASWTRGWDQNQPQGLRCQLWTQLLNPDDRHLLFFWMRWLIVVMMILMNSCMMSKPFLRPGACRCAGALRRLCQHFRRACKASRRTYDGSSPTMRNMYIRACPLLFCEMNICFSLPTLISVSGVLPWCSCVVGLHLQGPVQCTMCKCWYHS